MFLLESGIFFFQKIKAQINSEEIRFGFIQRVLGISCLLLPLLLDVKDRPFNIPVSFLSLYLSSLRSHSFASGKNNEKIVRFSNQVNTMVIAAYLYLNHKLVFNASMICFILFISTGFSR